jgi:PD-(D/E)XK endonuclease
MSPPKVSDLEARLTCLRSAAGTLAAAWFALRGCAVSLPIEPTQYDLLVGAPEGISRVQVKSTTCSTKDGWMATVGHHPDTHSKKGHLLAYDPDEIDLFFIVDGDMTIYLIPSTTAALCYWPPVHGGEASPAPREPRGPRLPLAGRSRTRPSRDRGGKTAYSLFFLQVMKILRANRWLVR